VQLLSFGGFWGGLALGAVLAPQVSRHVNSDIAKTTTAVVVVFGLAILLGGVGERVGARIRTGLRVTVLGPLDSGIGAAIGVAATLLAIWVITAMISIVSIPSISRPLSQSAIVKALVNTLPPAPAVFAGVGHLLAPSGLPQVFAGLEPGPPAPLPTPSTPAVEAAVAAAGESTVKIEGLGCGGVKTGSGWVAAPGLVVTNAHVVAGIAAPYVVDRENRRHLGTRVVLFDPEVDIAVLRVTNLPAARPLPLVRSDEPRGTVGAVLGYPGGGPFTASPAVLLTQIEATGRDIYNQNVTTRSVYEIQADVRPGNSGGPFVTTAGQVVGVVFSASVYLQNVGFALTGREIAPEIDRAQSSVAEVSTGACSS
ncbi:MAG: MarP family serine protease, partial [Actinobacteria bacterium]